MIITTVSAVILILPFLVDSKIILQISPTCTYKTQFNLECFFCGMSRAFIEISKGNLSSAISLNRGSLFLFILFSINIIIFSIYFIYKTFQKGKNYQISRTH
ncbi:DUF2752 domain-containing protein [Profundicola chukchiensis]|uniref:DUF2752 domain-containing protein n=1 Tax=Profundicola chukchiensis TaxID=2961959 RepID=UPI0034E20F2B